jgi:hypothetical protein
MIHIRPPQTDTRHRNKYTPNFVSLLPLLIAFLLINIGGKIFSKMDCPPIAIVKKPDMPTTAPV